jgi:hypothetical protein
MASKVEDITINFEQDGVVLVKELEKYVLSKGAWTTIIFRYRQWDQGKQDYSGDRFTIRRYRKVNQEYRQQSKFNISSKDQAQQIIEVLQAWLQE